MEQTDSPQWEDLLPDALGLIFKHLSFRETFAVIPQVCKSWGEAVRGPYCWQEIDIEAWSCGSEPEKIDQMLRLLITRSSGSMRKLCVSGLKLESSFNFIAEHVHPLQVLKLPRSEVSDPWMENVAGNLSNLTHIDLSYCGKIGSGALEAIGMNCKFLTRLSRNMHPLDLQGRSSQNDEAHAIATRMPKLKHLEIAYNLVDTTSVLEIITNCTELEFLDLRGCWDVEFDEQYIKAKFPKLQVLGPAVVDHYGEICWDECSDFSDSSYEYEGSDGLWDYEDNFNFRFYEGLGEYTAYGWPPSP